MQPTTSRNAGIYTRVGAFVYDTNTLQTHSALKGLLVEAVILRVESLCGKLQMQVKGVVVSKLVSRSGLFIRTRYYKQAGGGCSL